MAEAEVAAAVEARSSEDRGQGFRNLLCVSLAFAFLSFSSFFFFL
jgi:hypothetical protein